MSTILFITPLGETIQFVTSIEQGIWSFNSPFFCNRRHCGIERNRREADVRVINLRFGCRCCWLVGENNIMNVAECSER